MSISIPLIPLTSISYVRVIEIGIAVSNISGVGIEEMADTTLSLILQLYRRTYWLAQYVMRDGQKVVGPDHLREVAAGATRIRGDTLGIIGLGMVFVLYCIVF